MNYRERDLDLIAYHINRLEIEMSGVTEEGDEVTTYKYRIQIEELREIFRRLCGLV